MANVCLNLKKNLGTIKLMNCVNNGPTAPNVRKSPTSFDAYKALEIPYARTHDSSYFTGYGGEHTIDVHRIFRDFDANENDPASYIFEPTDGYIRTILAAGTKVFYRLGASIEHGFKFGSRVPKDFAKWARICEHIIRHYNEGWADGMHADITYWEIWNEPDNWKEDGSNPCWQGTGDEFTELYCVTAKHLKACFPSIRIGGCAFSKYYPNDMKDAFLDRIAREQVPLDFYSYHWYGTDPHEVEEAARVNRSELDRRGLMHTESILNEWNYIRGWRGPDWMYSLDTEKKLKGAAFLAGVMCTAQTVPLDMLMYYDARPCEMNGLFEQETYRSLKGAQAFDAFRVLRSLGNWVPAVCDCPDIYACAATDGRDSAVLLVHYHENDSLPPEEVCLEISGSTGEKKAEFFVTDAENDNSLVSVQYMTAGRFVLHLNMKMYDMVLLRLTNV